MRRGSPLASLVVVTFALFTDAFVYGLVIPLASELPAANEGSLTLALTYGAYGLGVLLAVPVIGPLTDHVGRRLPLLIGLVCLAVATLLFGLASSLPLLVLARVVQGIASTANWTAGLALVADSYTHKRTQMMGIAMMGSSGGSVLGPVAGGLLLEIGGYQWPFIAAGLLLALDGVLRLTLVVDPPREASVGASPWELLRDRGVLAATLVVLLGAGGWSVIEPLLPEHLAQATVIGPTAIGLMFTISTLTNGLSAPWIGNVADRIGLWPTMFAGLVLMAVTLPFLGLITWVVLLTAVLMVLNVSYGVVLNPSLSELAEAVDRRGVSAYGAVYAVYNIGYSVGQIGSNLLGGAVATSVSFQGALLATSVGIVVCMPLVYAIRPRLMRVAPAPE
ncbi:MAG TPA: MFS transporter [Chloroflexota bacterium]|nr:MFS transporter [Chloroflexota bacterium]